MIAPFIYLSIILRYTVLEGITPIITNEYLVNLITMVLAFVAISSLTMGYLVPRFMINRYKREQQVDEFQSDLPGYLLRVDIVRSAFFEAVAVYGLMLWLFGVRWGIYLTFIVATVVALILSFPTEGRWRKMLD